jgi:Uma2 family endonuclease
MKLSDDYAPEPDLLVVTTPNLGRLEKTKLVGAADLVVEIISPESGMRDRGFKFDQYEAGGVKEYWLIDPERRQAYLYVLEDEGLYRLILPDAQGDYTSRVLPRLRLKVSLLFESPIPDAGHAVEWVNHLLGE